MHNGVLVEAGCYYGDWMTEVIRRLDGHHEPQEEAAFHLVVERIRASGPPDPVMLELGSFWAYYSLWMARSVPRARLVLVEPDLTYLEVGRRNMALNGATGRFINAAIGTPDGASTDFRCESDGRRRPVPLATVDGIMDRERLDHVDLLLCDTQGAELTMLEGAVRALAERRIRFMVISTHHHTISGDPRTHMRCLDLVSAAGVHVIAEHTVSESFSGDGLIVASLDRRDFDLSLDLSLARARDSLFGEVEPDLARALADRDALASERDALAAQRDAVAAERDALAARLNAGSPAVPGTSVGPSQLET
jgi:FkbM family methyltransferase